MRVLAVVECKPEAGVKKRTKDFTGQRFGKLVAMRDTGRRTPSYNAIWELKCDCGGVRFADTGKLKAAVSCGCSLKTQFSCSVAGCGEAAKCKNLCERHYKYSRKKPKTVFDIAERLAMHTRRVDSGCIEWIRSTTGSGYALTTVKGRRIGVHRLVYERERGPIPEGMFVCHKCDNPRCCNIEHLFIGTQKDNIHDAMKKGRMKFPWQKANG